jgi:mRNA interferase YafQ
MLAQRITRRFAKDRKRMKKRNKDTNKLDELMRLITNEVPLPESCREHLLHGTYEGWTECHVEPNWLLVYKFGEDTVLFDRTGTHSDLF